MRITVLVSILTLLALGCVSKKETPITKFSEKREKFRDAKQPYVLKNEGLNQLMDPAFVKQYLADIQISGDEEATKTEQQLLKDYVAQYDNIKSAETPDIGVWYGDRLPLENSHYLLTYVTFRRTNAQSAMRHYTVCSFDSTGRRVSCVKVGEVSDRQIDGQNKVSIEATAEIISAGLIKDEQKIIEIKPDPKSDMIANTTKLKKKYYNIAMDGVIEHQPE